MPIQIGVISDIHADLARLEAALALLKAHGVDQIICAGDLVEKGLDGDAVVRLIRAWAIPCVLGNHDVDAVNNQKWFRENSRPDSPFLLADDTLKFLQILPETLASTQEGLRMLVAHGVPGNEQIHLRHFNPPDYFARWLRGVQADILILGHTHQPMRALRRGMWIVNPGSVCGPLAAGSGTCGILALPECTFEVYDIASRNLLPDVPFTQIP